MIRNCSWATRSVVIDIEHRVEATRWATDVCHTDHGSLLEPSRFRWFGWDRRRYVRYGLDILYKVGTEDWPDEIASWALCVPLVKARRIGRCGDHNNQSGLLVLSGALFERTGAVRPPTV